MATNPFDEFQPVTPANPFDEFEPVAPGTRAVLQTAIGTNPDQAARAAQLAKQYQAPVDVLARNLQDVELQAVVDKADERLKTSPKLAQALRDKPWLAQQAHDDIEPLAAVESLTAARADRTAMGALGDVGVVALKGAVGLPQAFIGLGNLVSAGYVGKGAEAIGIRFEDAQAFLDGMFSPAQQQANEAVREAEGFFDTLGAMLSNPSTIAATVGESAPQMLGGAALGRGLLAAAPKLAPWLAAAFGEGIMGAGSSAEQIRQDNEDGLLSAKQVFAATMSGAGTALFGAVGGRTAQRLGLGDIDTALVARGLDDATAKTLRLGFVTSIGKAGISEGVFEELPQSIQEQLWQNWATDRPLGEGVGKAAAQGLLAGLSMGGGFQAVSNSAATLDRVLTEREAARASAEGDAQRLTEAMATAAQSKLRDRNPETFQQLVDTMALGQDGAPAAVYIDANVLLQSATPEQLAQILPSTAEQLQEAAATNSAIEVPVAEALTYLPGTPLEQVFLQNARSAPDALSLAEATQAGEQAQQFLQQEAERVMQQAADTQAWQAGNETVKTTILDQLNTTGRFTPDVNEAYAALQTNFFSTMAARLGITPQEMYDRYSLKVQAGGQQGAVLDQGSRWFSEDNRLSNLNPNGASWQRIRENNPLLRDKGLDDEITVYRATIGDTIRPDDYVAVDKATLRKELKNVRERDGKDAKIISQKVKVRDLLMGNDATEFVYFPAGELNQSATNTEATSAQQQQVSATSDAQTAYNQAQAATETEALNQAARATFNPQTFVMTLNENADLSSFLHESGHFFLEVMADLASQPDAPAQVREDMDKLLAWFGVPDLATWNGYQLDQKRQYHERFAESFEQYLLEGKAPSAELQPLFRRFRSWLVNVYKSLQQFMQGRDLQISDDIRQVFDRLLATDEQIAAAEEAAGVLPDFDATNEAIERLQSRSLRDLKWTINARNKAIKALQKQAASLRKGVQEEVTAEVEQMPEMLAKRQLDALRKENKRAPNDVEMATVAEATGYESADAMLAAIDAFGKPKDVIEGMTDQRMLERHGDLVDQRAIEQAANEAVHNEARARSLATELKAQTELAGQREDTGRVASNGRPITVNAIAKAAKDFAANLAARRKVKDLKNAAWQHRAAEARAGKAWQAATAAGKTQEAVQAKRDQVLNNAAAKALQEAQTEVKKIEDFARRVLKGNDEKVVERGRDPDVVNAMRAILGAYGWQTAATKRAEEYMDVVSRNDPVMYAALQPSVTGAMVNAKPWDTLSMEELRGLHDELRAMWNLAKASRQMEVDGNMLDIDDAEAMLQDRMQEIGVPDTIPGERGAITAREEVGIKLQFAKAILSRVEQWAERIDGKFGGPFLRLVFQPIKDAADSYRTDRVKYRQRFTQLLKDVAPAMGKGPIVAPELGYTFGNARDSGTAELLHAILHTGNDSNKRKLLLGRGWATENADGTLDTTKWDTFVQRLVVEGKLRKEHFDFAQGVWDLLEETKPLAQAAHRRVFGRYFAEITANEFIDPFGTVRRGGYVPAQTDARIVTEAKLRELAEAENESMAYAFPSAPNGFTKARVDYNKPLLLDLRTLAQHMDKVLLFSHMQPAVNDVRRLLTRKGVSYSLDRIDPGAYEGMLTPWLQRSARQVVETPIVGDRKLSRFLSAARSRAGMALMFANLSNTVQQITGFSSAAVKVKPSLMVKAAAQFTASPKALKRQVADASPFMKDRMLNEVSAMNDAIEQILIDPTLLERGQAWTQKHAYFMQTAVDNTMSPIIWTAAYNQAIEQGQTAKDAVRFADGVVRQTQGTTLPEDVSRFETGPAYARLFTQFIGYFNMMANTNATAVKQIVDEMGLRKGAGKLVYVGLAGLMVPIWVAELIANAFRGGPEDEDDDGYLDDWLMAVFGIGTVRGLAAQIPFVGQGAQLVVNRFNDNPADDKFSLSPAVSLIESAASAPASVYKAIVDEGSAQKAVRDVATAATLLTGLPIYAASRPLGYLAGSTDGKITPTGPADAARGLVTGTASPDSKTP